MFFNIYVVELYKNTIETTSMIVMKKIIANYNYIKMDIVLCNKNIFLNKFDHTCTGKTKPFAV